jgi:hypothetical protein
LLIHRFAQRSWPSSLVSHLEDEQDNTPKIHTTKLSGIRCQKNDIKTTAKPFNPKQVGALLEIKPTKRWEYEEDRGKNQRKKRREKISGTHHQKKNYII